MAQIDATGLRFDFDASDAGDVQYAVAGSLTADHITWTTGTNAPYFRITALSDDQDLADNPLSGTINAVNIVNDVDSPGLSITGVHVALASLIDRDNPSNNEEKFWDSLLAGPTTILAPTLGAVTFTMMGDFVTVANGKTLVGAADSFVGSQTADFGGAGSIYGDAVTVLDGANLTGGRDSFTGDLADLIIGDAYDSSGALTGGNDVFSYIDTSASPKLSTDSLIGDVDFDQANGVLQGGNDSFTLRNFVSINEVIGDAGSVFGTSFGGNDTILAETTIAGRSFANISEVIGDDDTLEAEGAVSNSGNDSITLHNISTGDVIGDVYSLSGTGHGGNDSIVMMGVGLSDAQMDPFTDFISGDVRSSVQAGVDGGALTGGNDTISVVDVRFTAIAGDIIDGSSHAAFVGGADVISVDDGRSVQQITAKVIGDAEDSAANSITGGSDRITVDLRGSASGSSVTIIGDVDTISVTGDAGVHEGNDFIRYTTDASAGQQTIYGDSRAISATGDLVLVEGDDTIIGGASDDILYGDTPGLTPGTPGQTVTGGADSLDGGGGNDRLIGGDGIDTAAFGLAQSVYVNLNGIPGNGGTNIYNAIGQGNDQFVSIENVTGSTLADTIIGDGHANVLQGMNGADRLDGGSGADTLSGGTGNDTVVGGVGGDSIDGGADVDTLNYGLSAAAVIVNLATGAASGGDAQGDKFAHFENVTGSSHSDRLTGDGSVNILTGGAGNDVLDGGAGNDALLGGDDKDVLTGGLGRDILTGGAAADRFVFTARTETSPGSNRDIIADFSHAQADRIDLSAIDANNQNSTSDAFTFIGTAAFSHHAGELHFVYSGSSTTIVEADIDGNGTADLQIQLTGHIALVAGDFVL